MPRARKPGSGGPRVGTPGKTYANRTDLSTAVAPSQQYGQGAAQQNALSAMPIPQGGASAGPTAPPGVPQVPSGPAPGGLTPLSAPTQRPDEPLTSGMPFGPGPGPVAPPDPLVHGAVILNALGSVADSSTQRLRAQINAQLANQAAP